MKTETWILLGIGAYWLYSQSQHANRAPVTYPTYQGGPYVPGSSRSTGSGGTVASLPGVGIGVSVTNPPIGGIPGNPSWSGNPSFNNPSSGYVQCLDGSWASEEWQCPENYAPSGYACADGEIVSDPSHCPEAQGL